MKRVTPLALAALCLAGAPLTAETVEAETVEEILARYVEARGGQEAFDKVDTIRSSGKMVMGGGFEAPIEYEWKKPNKFRFEMTMQGVTQVSTYDGENGLTLDPSEAPEPVPFGPDDFMQLNDAIDFIGPLVDAEAKGHEVELLGEEDVEGTPAWKLKLTKAGGEVEHIYLDAEYFVEIRQVEFHDVAGNPLEVEVTWGDYKEVGGILLPHSWNQRPPGGGQGLNLLFDGFEVNEELPDSRFSQATGE